MDKRWIGVDLDGTLAHYSGWKGPQHIGPAIPEMLDRVRDWLADGKTVKIFTARAAVPANIPYVKDWLRAQGLPDLEVTNAKDFDCVEIWDDSAVELVANTGRPANILRRLVK
jgi:hypothetical protein